MLNQVFLSYRHESPEHARAVHRLGELLRQSGLPVALDQFHLDEHPGGSDVGWPKWSEDCAIESACVVIVASEGWFGAYDKTAPPGLGLGAATEADLFRQALWDEQGCNARIRLAFLHDVAADKVPPRLRAWHQFRPFTADEQLNQLIRWVGGCLGLQNIELPTVRWPAPLEFQPDLADRNKKEWPAVIDLLAGRSRERILLYEGGTGLGKSELLRQAAVYAKKLGIAVVWVNFKGGGLSLAEVLGQFDLDLSVHLPNFAREGASKTHLLRKDLRALRQPVLIIFDSYEAAHDNKPVADWLSQQYPGGSRDRSRPCRHRRGSEGAGLRQRRLAQPNSPSAPGAHHRHQALGALGRAPLPRFPGQGRPSADRRDGCQRQPCAHFDPLRDHRQEQLNGP